MGVDRFGNSHAPDLTYARGEILRSTEDDFRKLQRAWSLIRERGPGSIYIFTGLDHGVPLAAEELKFADDEIAPALSFERLKELALDHLGGSPDTDDVAVFNRLRGATDGNPSDPGQAGRRRNWRFGEPQPSLPGMQGARDGAKRWFSRAIMAEERSMAVTLAPRGAA
jgi:hypothetical protein